MLAGGFPEGKQDNYSRQQRFSKNQVIKLFEMQQRLLESLRANSIPLVKHQRKYRQHF